MREVRKCRGMRRNKSESEKLNKVKSSKKGKAVTVARYKWIQSSELTRHHQFPFRRDIVRKLAEWSSRYVEIRSEDYREATTNETIHNSTGISSTWWNGK